MAFDDTGSGGTLHISMHGAAPVPANDTIGHAAVVSRVAVQARRSTPRAPRPTRSTRQANASCGAPATGNSVWYKFTAGPNDRNIFVDASASDYAAGVLIATGTPGALTTVTCGPFFVTATTDAGHHVLHHDLRLPSARVAAR